MAATTSIPEQPAFVTNSRRGDLLLFGLFLAVSLAAAPWLRVYYRITSFEVELTRLSANGERTAAPLPSEFDFGEYWNRTPDDLLRHIERTFRRVMQDRLSQQPPGTRYELTVRYSFNSPDRDRTVTWEAP